LHNELIIEIEEDTPPSPPHLSQVEGGGGEPVAGFPFCTVRSALMRIALAVMMALAIKGLMRSNINMVSPFLDNFKRFKQCGLKRPKKSIAN
jgi:hypothetical protein